MQDKLKEAREIINRTDEDMAELFVRRMEAVRAVADYKVEHGLPITDTAREAEVISKNASLVKDEELRSFYISFIKDTMAISRSYQSRLLQGMRIAYAGTEGAFAHIAASKIFPSGVKVGYGDFESAYRSVESGECDAAVLPIENSSQGEVAEVTDLAFSGSLYVNGVTDLAITQDLLALPGASLSDIKRVVSHPQALGQCREYIKAHGLESVEYPNTALAAAYVKEKGDASVAAIASAEAANIFGLDVIERNVNSSRTNTTRFAVFSRTQTARAENERGVHTILTFTVRNEAGALARAIEIIGRHRFNMQSLRSRPMKELLWQYYFYVEAEGNIFTPEGQAMLQELSGCCDRLKIIGSYIKI